jgi:transposase InsO family protein
MPWKECDRVSLREEFVALVGVGGISIGQLCQRFGISRKTGHKWLRRVQDDPEHGLQDRSRRPQRFHQPTPQALERLVLAVRRDHPAWGGRKIRRLLQDRGRADVPAASTITRILWRHGKIDPQEAAKHRPYQRFEKPAPNDLWQMDFKGEFACRNGRDCYPLTVLDDHSRYALGLVACANTQLVTVQQALIGIFRRYGRPQAILSDNGPPWGSGQTPGGWSRLGVWLLRLDIELLHGRPWHPQTQGKDERFHRTLNRELLAGRDVRDLADAQTLFNPWRDMYNRVRPHDALDLATPASRYRPSDRSYPEGLPTIEYDSDELVRRVHRNGYFAFQGRRCWLSEAFGRESIALRPSCRQGLWHVCYGRHWIGTLDLAAAAPGGPVPVQRATRAERQEGLG